MGSLAIAFFLARPVRRAAFSLYRLRIASRYYAGQLKQLVLWLFRSRETTNFTYDLTKLNQRYLASLIADVLCKPYEEVLGYMAELEADEDLQGHIRTTIQNRGDERADTEARYGRRLGWYAIARAMKPQVVVETGVDKGLGSCVLTAALSRNSAEGFSGYYYGTDINPKAGYLLCGPYKNFGEILYGDSLASLRQLNTTIDLFINDSDHSRDYEGAEYGLITSRLSARGIVLGDNAHCNDELLLFALATGRNFVFFHEVPERHWYPGGGIGIAFKRT
jgi:hypothetical protein